MNPDSHCDLSQVIHLESKKIKKKKRSKPHIFQLAQSSLTKWIMLLLFLFYRVEFSLLEKENC